MEKAARTVRAIGAARGYVFDESEQLDSDARMVFAHETGTVLVAIEDKLTLSVAKAIATHAEQVGAVRLIAAFGANPTSAARAILVEHVGNRHIEFFTHAELGFDIMKHELVPKFEVLENEEVAKVLQTYRIKHAQLPRMHVSDPCARYLGLARGQVVRVTRASAEYGASIAYRIVT
jgi:DNA-directed RNA polymerase I, II, and III subunit RPABC1